MTVQQEWRELSSEKSTGGNTASTDPGLCPALRQRITLRNQFYSVTVRVVQLQVQGSKEATDDRARYDYAFAAQRERFIAFCDGQVVTGNGDELKSSYL